MPPWATSSSKVPAALEAAEQQARLAVRDLKSIAALKVVKKFFMPNPP